MEQTDRIAHKRTLAVRLLLVALCLIGVFAPLDTQPHPSNACIPLASSEICISLTCLILLPFLWTRFFRKDEAPVRWPEDSPQLKRWFKLRKWISWAAVAVLVASICFYRRWHQGQINLQMTIASPGYMFLAWRLMIDTYIRARALQRLVDEADSRDDYVHSPPLAELKPLHSDHWGNSARNPVTP